MISHSYVNVYQRVMVMVEEGLMRMTEFDCGCLCWINYQPWFLDPFTARNIIQELHIFGEYLKLMETKQVSRRFVVEHGPRFGTNDWDGNHRFGIMVWINGLGSIVVKPCIFNQWCFFQSPFFATRFGWLTQHYQHLPTIDVGCVFQFDLQFKMVLRAWYLEQNKPFSEPKYIDGSPWQGCSNLLYDPSCMPH